MHSSQTSFLKLKFHSPWKDQEFIFRLVHFYLRRYEVDCMLISRESHWVMDFIVKLTHSYKKGEYPKHTLVFWRDLRESEIMGAKCTSLFLPAYSLSSFIGLAGNMRTLCTSSWSSTTSYSGSILPSMSPHVWALFRSSLKRSCKQRIATTLYYTYFQKW